MTQTPAPKSSCETKSPATPQSVPVRIRFRRQKPRSSRLAGASLSTLLHQLATHSGRHGIHSLFQSSQTHRNLLEFILCLGGASAGSAKLSLSSASLSLLRSLGVSGFPTTGSSIFKTLQYSVFCLFLPERYQRGNNIFLSCHLLNGIITTFLQNSQYYIRLILCCICCVFLSHKYKLFLPLLLLFFPADCKQENLSWAFSLNFYHLFMSFTEKSVFYMGFSVGFRQF